jgi:hypothetical protein
MLEAALESLRLLLHASQMCACSLDKWQLGVRGNEFRDRLLEVRIGHLIGIELRVPLAVTPVRKRW